MAEAKLKLWELLVQRNLVSTRQQAEALIMAGRVKLAGRITAKAGQLVSLGAKVGITPGKPFAGRGGYKLAHALDRFGIVVQNRICADVGCSVGGFTDVLLQRGALRIYAIDVGYGELAWKLRQNPRVVVMERTNARLLDKLAEAVSFVSIDVSFISLRLILPKVKQWLDSGAVDIVALIKPQFEAPRGMVDEGGIVRSANSRLEVLREVLSWCVSNRLNPVALERSPIQGIEGNVEYLSWLKPGEQKDVDIEALIDPLFMEEDTSARS